MWRSHFLNMLVFALCTSILLALYFKDEPRDQIRFFLKVWVLMVVGALIVAWIMYFLGGSG